MVIEIPSDILILWLSQFTERQQSEINFSRVYAEDFDHGTDGHNAKVIIAKMAAILDDVELAINGAEDRQTIKDILSGADN